MNIVNNRGRCMSVPPCLCAKVITPPHPSKPRPLRRWSGQGAAVRPHIFDQSVTVWPGTGQGVGVLVRGWGGPGWMEGPRPVATSGQSTLTILPPNTLKPCIGCQRPCTCTHPANPDQHISQITSHTWKRYSIPFT